MSEHIYDLTQKLSEWDIRVQKVDEREFPGERWLIIYVDKEDLVKAQSFAGPLERELNQRYKSDSAFAVTFRSSIGDPINPDVPNEVGPLASQNVTQLIQLLEARSRTSDALPSLRYVEDPRASLAATIASRHHLIYGRRGVGKTSLLLEAKSMAEKQGHVAIWVNTHIVRRLDADAAYLVIADLILSAIITHLGSSRSPTASRLSSERDSIAALRSRDRLEDGSIDPRIASINSVLRGVLRDGVVRMYVFLDDFYLLPGDQQPLLLDYLAGTLRDCNGWLKVASIERLTRPFEPSSRTGLELPHDASKIDLDVTLENPKAAQIFLESVLSEYTIASGVGAPSVIAKSSALGRLVLASGGVPRDYLNLFASSIVVARKNRTKPDKIGSQDVAQAAGDAARSKKRDLDQDVSSARSSELISALDAISSAVRGAKYTYFRVDISQNRSPGYEVLARLVDLRFAHLIEASLSDQHRAGIKYEVYVLDLSEYADVRLKRGLNVLDLENGQWTNQFTGKANSLQRLTGTRFRDHLRQTPILKLGDWVV